MKKAFTVTFAAVSMSIFTAIVSFAGMWTGSNEAGWRYTKDDGSPAVNEWVQDTDGKWYYFENDVMAHDKWIDGTYYVGSSGAMYVNETTPDGYYVGSDGAWIRERHSGQNTAVDKAVELFKAGLVSGKYQKIDVYKEGNDTVVVDFNITDGNTKLDYSAAKYVASIVNYFDSTMRESIEGASKLYGEQLKLKVNYFYNGTYSITKEY